jgi:hypothetical protein
MTLENGTVFFHLPRFLANGGIKVIVPPLPALFANSSGQVTGDFAPLFRTQRLDQFHDLLVFFFRPWSLDGLNDTRVSRLALIGRPARAEFDRHGVPVRLFNVFRIDARPNKLVFALGPLAGRIRHARLAFLLVGRSSRHVAAATRRRQCARRTHPMIARRRRR